MKRLKIGIVGCGAIGSFLAKHIEKDFKNKSDLIGICDIDNKKAKLLSKFLQSKPAVLNLESLIRKSDLVIEAASSRVSYQIAVKSIRAGKNIMIMSVGGLIDKGNLFALAKKKNCAIYLPSGAISGLDALKAASMAKIKKVVLTTKKSPRALKGAPFIERNKIDLDSIKKETVIFNGTAKEAIKGFPQNINVAATLSLAGIGARRTCVRIISSPQFRHNIHEVEVTGDFGRMVSRTENLPSPENPKTSYLAMLSALAMLKQILEPIKIGT